MKKFVFIIFLLLNACGYQSVNKIDKLNYKISKYKLLGNKEINKILKKNFDRNNNNINYENNFEIVAISSLVKSKNSQTYSNFKLRIFILGVIAISISEISTKFYSISFDKSSVIFFIPFILFFLIYQYFIKQFNLRTHDN